MFIRKTTTKKYAKNGKAHTTYRLVSTYRNAQSKVKQETLLNLGSAFNVPEEQWRVLTDKVEQLLSLGDLSTLKETIDTCWAYHRDRKESYDTVKAQDIKYSDLEKYANNSNVDYIYIYNEEFEWECFKYNSIYATYFMINILSERVFTEALN
jgi:hypothetical protein